MLILRGRLVSAALPAPPAVMASFRAAGGVTEGQTRRESGQQSARWHPAVDALRPIIATPPTAAQRAAAQQSAPQPPALLPPSPLPRPLPPPTVAQRAAVQQLVRVDAGNGAASDVAHVVHARLW